jgi:hypothetical protein
VSLVSSEFGSDVNPIGIRLGEAGNTAIYPPKFVAGGAILIGATTDRLITSTSDILIHVDPIPPLS